MSGCERLSDDALAALLTGTLPVGARGELAEHLREATCEVCLARLEAVDGDRLLEALAGPDARLSPAESEAMFDAAVGARVVPIRRRTWAWGALVAAAASVVLALSVGLPAVDDGMQVKAGGTGIDVALEGVVGRRVDGGDPIIDRRFARQGRLEAGESVLFRYRLSKPAHLTLVIDRGSGGAVEWTAPPGPLEAEVAHDGRALSLDAERVPAGASVWLIASTVPLRTATTAPGARPSCTGCTVAGLEIAR